MAPDSFEPDNLASTADGADESEALMHEPAAAAPRPARLSLFQRVCLGDKLQAKPAS